MAMSLEGLCFLVVDDNEFIRRLLRRVFVSLGVGKVIEAADGRDGYEAYLNGLADVVFTDWVMEPVDGLTLVRDIRNKPDSPDPYTPIIMITAYAELERIEQARDAGVNEVLAKPFTIAGIVSRLESVIVRPRSFVRTDYYFGPERRRKTVERSEEPERRVGAENCEPHDVAAEAAETAMAKVAGLSGNQPDGESSGS